MRNLGHLTTPTASYNLSDDQSRLHSFRKEQYNPQVHYRHSPWEPSQFRTTDQIADTSMVLPTYGVVARDIRLLS